MDIDSLNYSDMMNPLDFDGLLKEMNGEWLSTDNMEDPKMEETLLDFGQTTFEPLSVMPPETWNDSLLYIKPDPELLPVKEEPLSEEPLQEELSTRLPVKREAKKPIRRNVAKKPRFQNVDDKHQKRLEANKLSAQLSRDRKKQLKIILESKMSTLTDENATLGTEITKLEAENKVLKSEFVQLQNLIYQSPVLSKLMAQKISLNLPSIEEMENKKFEKLQRSKEPSSPLPLFTPSASSDPTALMYLMIVMQTFQNYWQQVTNNNQMNMQTLPLTVV